MKLLAALLLAWAPLRAAETGSKGPLPGVVLTQAPAGLSTVPGPLSTDGPALGVQPQIPALPASAVAPAQVPALAAAAPASPQIAAQASPRGPPAAFVAPGAPALPSVAVVPGRVH